MKKNQELLDKGTLEGYNLGVLRLVACRHLPQDARHKAAPHMRKRAYSWWSYMVRRAPKCELIPVLLPYVNNGVLASLRELQEQDILRRLKGDVKKRHNSNSPARRKAHQKYHHEVVSPRRKATRHYIAEHPEIVNEIKVKYGL